MTHGDLFSQRLLRMR